MQFHEANDLLPQIRYVLRINHQLQFRIHSQRLPTRLLELVHKYSFTHRFSPPTMDIQLLPYPQVTTALHPVLFVSNTKSPHRSVSPTQRLTLPFFSPTLSQPKLRNTNRQRLGTVLCFRLLGINQTFPHLVSTQMSRSLNCAKYLLPSPGS
jgi:hypothetical protein